MGCFAYLVHMGLRILLWPFSLLYGSILWWRNKFFDWGWLPSQSYHLPIISVGNITVGGTGKTPLTEYIIRLLKPAYSVALLSRGYKRRTSGTIISSTSSTAEEIGDEPKQVKSKFPDICVAVAEKRTEGIERLLDFEKPDLIVMDDAYQHRYVTPGYSILIVDYYRPLWNDFPFPAGNLREPQSGKKRADIIIINKCPATLSLTDKEILLKKLKPRAGQQVFFTSIEYTRPHPLMPENQNTLSPDMDVLALAGIAHPKTFLDYLSDTYHKTHPLVYPDHHPYNKKDYTQIKEHFNSLKSQQKAIITTEKDMVRLKNLPYLDEEIKSNIWYIPIKLTFLFDEEPLINELITSYVETNARNC
jgi:tetraacyldisaccharide 4'-kinase